MNEAMVLECKKLSKHYQEGASQVSVLNNVDFQVRKNELVAIMGASGAGKSTLLHLLGGLDQPTSGQVLIQGHDIHRLSEREKSRLRNEYLGFVYQFHHILPEFNALENVAMPLLIRGVHPKQAAAQAADILDRVGLTPRKHHRLGELSGGERQRVAIARALATNPVCILADEPTGNLDQKTAATIVDLLLALNQDFKTSIIIVTHDAVLAKKMNRILVLQQGDLQAAHL